jgi:hypothetical protein
MLILPTWFHRTRYDAGLTQSPPVPSPIAVGRGADSAIFIVFRRSPLPRYRDYERTFILYGEVSENSNATMQCWVPLAAMLGLALCLHQL